MAQAPSFSNRALRTVVTGWQLAGIYRFLSGAPYSVQAGTDQQLSGITHQRPNLIDPNSVYTGLTCGGCFYIIKPLSLRNRWAPSATWAGTAY